MSIEESQTGGWVQMFEQNRGLLFYIFFELLFECIRQSVLDGMRVSHRYNFNELLFGEQCKIVGEATLLRVIIIHQ